MMMRSCPARRQSARRQSACREPARRRPLRRRRAITLLLAALGLVAGTCGERLEDPTEVSLDLILRMGLATGSAATLPADGASTTRFEARIPAEAETKHRKVKFETSLGVFVESGKSSYDAPTGVDGVATATLRAATTVGTATVAASVDVYRVDTTLEMTRAYPDRAEMETSSVVVALDGSKKPTLRLLLSRQDGSSVSLSTEVTFTAEQEGVGAVGRFFDLDKRFTDAAGKASIGFAGDTGDLLADVPVVITASVTGSNGELIARSLELAVQ